MKQQTGSIGLFGKLPAHGDFVQRNLTSGFINVWDEWLQHFIAGTQEQIGEDWLNIYLTSPIWRFVFSSGVIDENNWTGIMMPSVDRVGRYYPFSIVTKLSQDINPIEFLQSQTDWYQKIEYLALDALDGIILIDDLMSELNDLTFDHNSDYSRSSFSLESDGFQFDMEYEEQSISTIYPLLLDAVMTKSFQSYSAWHTSGSECINPCFFSTQGLPGIQKMPAMLNGNWQACSWQKPYVMNEIAGLRGGA